MKKSILCIAIVAGFLFHLGLNPAVAADKESQSSLQTRIDEVNSSTTNPKKMEIALQRIATETGVQIERVRAMHKNHPKVLAAGIMVSCVLADETKKEPGSFMEQHDSGKSWASLAEDNKVSLDKLSARLERLQKALKEEK